jgi:hypothetical protein
VGVSLNIVHFNEEEKNGVKSPINPNRSGVGGAKPFNQNRKNEKHSL